MGTLLRIGVDPATEPYDILADNPFVGPMGTRPEIWTYGLRNPWRFSFAPDGRRVVADVGQDTEEELSIASSGDNLGWDNHEKRCFSVFVLHHCQHDGSAFPFHGHDHRAGVRITSEYVYTGNSIPALTRKYVSAGFVSRRMCSMTQPDTAGSSAELHRLGLTGMLASTFGVDGPGRMYVADYPTHRLQLFGPTVAAVPLSEQLAAASQMSQPLRQPQQTSIYSGNPRLSHVGLPENPTISTATIGDGVA
ncbi:MAG: hypothetical protein ACJAZO_000146 [Myxococcota bacterium]